MAESNTSDSKRVVQGTSNAEQKDADGVGGGPQTETDDKKLCTQFPMPTIFNKEEYETTPSVACWFPNCRRKGTCYSIWTHVQTKHEVTTAYMAEHWSHTPWFQQARKEKNAALTKYRLENPPKTKKASAKRVSETAVALSGQMHEAGSASSGSTVIPVEKRTWSNVDLSSITKTINSNKSAKSIAIAKPGGPGSILSLMMIPIGTYENLRGNGYLEEHTSGDIQWNPDLPVQYRRDVLLAALPLTDQKLCLAKEFASHQTCEQMQPMVASAMPSTLAPPAGDAVSGECSLHSEVRNVLELLKKYISGEPKVELQKLRIKPDIAAWKQPKSWKDALRNKYPIKVERLVHPMFSEYMVARRHDVATQNQHSLAVARFVNMFEPIKDDEAISVDNILINVYSSDLFEKLQTVELCAPEYSGTRHIISALAHFGVWSRSVLYKNDAKAKELVKDAFDDFVTPWSKICRKAKDDREKQKHQADAKLLNAYHFREDLQNIAWFAYLCLKTIHHELCEKKEVTANAYLLFKATAYLVAAVYTNSSPNRAKEVYTLESAMVVMLSNMVPQICFSHILMLQTYS